MIDASRAGARACTGDGQGTHSRAEVNARRDLNLTLFYLSFVRDAHYDVLLRNGWITYYYQTLNHLAQH